MLGSKLGAPRGSGEAQPLRIQLVQVHAASSDPLQRPPGQAEAGPGAHFSDALPPHPALRGQGFWGNHAAECGAWKSVALAVGAGLGARALRPCCSAARRPQQLGPLLPNKGARHRAFAHVRVQQTQLLGERTWPLQLSAPPLGGDAGQQACASCMPPAAVSQPAPRPFVGAHSQPLAMITGEGEGALHLPGSFIEGRLGGA